MTVLHLHKKTILL